MTIGEKIKKHRLNNNLTQKTLAIKVGISEPAIRNYELGNRTPSDTQIEKIAVALNISKYALADPNLDSYIGIMHALFYLEKYFNLVPYSDEKNDYQNNMRFDMKTNNGRELNDHLEKWIKKRTALENGSITIEEYEEWINTFPKKLAEDFQHSRKSKLNF